MCCNCIMWIFFLHGDIHHATAPIFTVWGGGVVKCRDLEVFSEEENQRDTFLIISQSCFQRKNHLSAQGISLFIDCLRCSGPKSYTQASISAHIVRLFFHCASAYYVVFKKKINISNIYLSSRSSTLVGPETLLHIRILDENFLSFIPAMCQLGEVIGFLFILSEPG